jgi:hypothetical protein
MFKMKLLSIIFSFVLIISISSCRKGANVELIIHNAVIYTVDSSFSLYSSMAINEGYVVAIGTFKEITNNYSADEVIDMHGAFIYPGFNDAHCHFYGYAEMNAQYADLGNTKSFQEVLDRLATHYDLYKPEFLCGRGWDQNKWNGQQWPTNQQLNALYPDIPVYLVRVDGHAALCNEKALELAGIYPGMHVDGGEIQTINGQLTGILIDNAKELVRNVVPEIQLDERIKALQQAESNCFEVGLTSLTDAGLELNEIQLLDSLQNAGLLNIRINAMLNANNDNLNFLFTNGPIIKDRLQVQSIKLYADGALGSRGACLIEPYTDSPYNNGFLVNTPKFLDSVCNLAYQNNIQVCTHCIGDSAVRLMLNIYGKYLQKENNRRWRIEHAQVIHPKDLSKFSKYSIIPSIQATHATSDMLWADKRLGQGRTSYAYIYKDLLAQNGWLPNGTDFPIEAINPLYTFYASVFRTNHQGKPAGGFYSNQALSRADALRSMTIWAAKSAFREDYTGSIEAGKEADFVVLDKDIIVAEPIEILNTKILYTYVAGKQVFKLPSISE